METGGDQVVNPTNNLKRTRSNFDRLSWSRAKQGNAETGEEREYISLMSAFMMLTTWSTSSSNVLFPWCYGVLGLAGGPIFMLLSFFVNWTATRWTVDAAVATGSETFGDLGEALIGWKGRFIFEGSQILFQQLFLPVAIVLCVGAVQSLTIDVGWTDCNGNVAVIFTAIGLVLIQVSRELENVTGLAYVSAVLNCIMTACIAYEVTTSPSPAAGPDGELPEGANWEWFVYQGDHPERYHWTAVLGAFGIFVYACLPSCIVVETTAALHPKDRPKMWMAVNGSFFMYISIYFVAGIPSVYYWGGDIPEPIEFGNSPAGILIKCVLMYGTGLDFIIASITVNRWAVSYINPDFDYEWTKANTIKWFFYSVPPSGRVASQCQP